MDNDFENNTNNVNNKTIEETGTLQQADDQTTEEKIGLLLNDIESQNVQSKNYQKEIDEWTKENTLLKNENNLLKNQLSNNEQMASPKQTAFIISNAFHCSIESSSHQNNQNILITQTKVNDHREYKVSTESTFSLTSRNKKYFDAWKENEDLNKKLITMTIEKEKQKSLMSNIKKKYITDLNHLSKKIQVLSEQNKTLINNFNNERNCKDIIQKEKYDLEEIIFKQEDEITTWTLKNAKYAEWIKSNHKKKNNNIKEIKNIYGTLKRYNDMPYKQKVKNKVLYLSQSTATLNNEKSSNYFTNINSKSISNRIVNSNRNKSSHNIKLLPINNMEFYKNGYNSYKHTIPGEEKTNKNVLQKRWNKNNSLPNININIIKNSGFNINNRNKDYSNINNHLEIEEKKKVEEFKSLMDTLISEFP